jgi:hypothetical protein
VERNGSSSVDRGTSGAGAVLVNLLAMVWVAFLCIVLSIPDGFSDGEVDSRMYWQMLGLWYLLRGSGSILKGRAGED